MKKYTMTIKKVYRLENEKGEGPFSDSQECIKFLKPHYDPEQMLSNSKIPKKLLSSLSNLGFVFGWETLSKYKSFFKRNGIVECKKLGYKMVIYTPSLKLIFPDGQVMFFKETIPPDDLKNLIHFLQVFNLILKGNRNVKLK